jgi:AraC-like DNA-binding protein
VARTLTRPSVSDIHDAIAAGVGIRRYSLDDLARQLRTSRSQIQRVLHEDGRTFSDELRLARVRAATRLLRHGRPVAAVASQVGVSPDHLRVLFVREVGIAPGRLLRAARLLARMHRWKQQLPPPAGTRGYYAQRNRWRAAHEEAERLLAPLIPPAMVAWSRAALAHTARPDYRRADHRRVIRWHRRREHEQFARLLEEVVLRAHERRRGGVA